MAERERLVEKWDKKIEEERGKALTPAARRLLYDIRRMRNGGNG